MSNKFYKLFDSLEGLDEKSVSYLSNAIEKNNLKGFDYLEFKKSVVAMASMHDESTAIKSTFLTASNMGLTKERLLQSIEHYKNVLSKEKRQFDTALKTQTDQKINGKKEEKLKLKEHVVELKKKMAEIQQKINAYQERIDNSDAEIAAAQEKINDTKSRFEVAFDKFNAEIDQDYDLINSTL